jgi:hypothetical protein
MDLLDSATLSALFSSSAMPVPDIDLLQSRGDKDPLDFLSEVITSTNHYSDELKVQAANYLTPYLHSKRSVAAPAPRYVDSPVQVPNFQSVDEAENFLASLPVIISADDECSTAQSAATLQRLPHRSR